MAQLRKFYRSALLVLSFILISCSSVPKFTSERNNQSQNTKEDIKEFEDTSVLETVVGIASYYASEFHGRTTANGEIYDMYGLTAAHPAYPFGTLIRVTNMSNNKTVNIRINDRMPLHPERIIDLSYGAAEKLDMLQDGLAEVRLEIMEWGDVKDP